MNNLEFAQGWRKTRLLSCLRKRQTAQLADFIEARHQERFLRPIQELCKAIGNTQGYGFASMAICCLLIETVQSYRDGLPTTDNRELIRLRQANRVPERYQLPSNLKVRGENEFRRFFHDFRKCFPKLSAASFYKNVRCALLHQGQTKHRWTLRAYGSEICDPVRRIIYRNKFAEALEDAFGEYLRDLRTKAWTDALWVKASRKIWWLVRLS
jgi:hypothetical protein